MPKLTKPPNTPKPASKNYRITVLVSDDGVSDGSVQNEYLSQSDIIRQIETIETAGLTVQVQEFEQLRGPVVPLSGFRHPEYVFDAAHYDVVESYINVGFRDVITLPVLWGRERTGIVVYVGSTAMGVLTMGSRPEIARIMDVAGRLNLQKEKGKL